MQNEDANAVTVQGKPVSEDVQQEAGLQMNTKNNTTGKNGPDEGDLRSDPEKDDAGEDRVELQGASEAHTPEHEELAGGVERPEDSKTQQAEHQEEVATELQQEEAANHSIDSTREQGAGSSQKEPPTDENRSRAKGDDPASDDSKGEAAVADGTDPEQKDVEGPDEDRNPESADNDVAGDHGKDSESEHDDHEDDHEHHDEHIDFEELDKQKLVDFLVDLNSETDMRRVDRLLKQIKPAFDHIYEEERNAALRNFLKEEGNEEDDFEYRGDPLDERFNDYYNLLRDKRSQFFAELEKQKEANLEKKRIILDKIRDLVDGEETNVSIKAIRELQDEWRATGPVPPGHNKGLWANYTALLDRFYDARSIYFELKDLDRKKNLTAKLGLCEKAEGLDELKNVSEAVKELNELHDEFKHVGPVPREEQEALWIRFKTASDKIYAKRKVFVEELKKELEANMEKKLQLGDEVQDFLSFDSDRITEWNKKTKELIAIQKKWESIGGLPRDKAKEVNRKFWSAFKGFFNSKNAFFKKLEAHKDENLAVKEKLVERAEALKDSTEWEKTASELKKLQEEWRDVGPVPDNKRNETYKRFKAACDHFFDQRRAQNREEHKIQEENYKKKWAICDQLEELSKAENMDLDAAYDLADEYLDLGFVPRNVVKKMHKRFDGVVAMITNSPSLDDADKSEFQMHLQVHKLRNSPNSGRKINRKENALRRKIAALETDIDTYRTNRDFFASSKKADALKDDINKRIDRAEDELEGLRKELRLLTRG